MIMPWWVGKISNFQTSYTNDLAYCNAHGIDYQGCCYPGTAFYNTNGASSPKNQISRQNGNFMWSMFAGMRNAGVQTAYIAMFDELNEATSIFKVAEDSSMIPAGKYFQTLDADGTHCSSDFCLRLVTNGIKMVKGTIPFQATHTTPFVMPVSTDLEAENLTVASTSAGDTHRLITDAGFRGGAGTILDGTAVNDQVTYVFPNVSAGSYNVRIGIKKLNTRGIWQLAIGPAGGSFTNLGSPQDSYSATPAFVEVNLGTWSPGTSSYKWFRFTITGKNASSTGYTESFDYITLTPQ